MTLSERPARRARLSKLVVIAIWTSAAILWTILLTLQNISPTPHWLLDWHVYAAGARDFLGGSLYTGPLESSYRLPIGEFNYPPLSAISVIPLLVLPDAVGGTTWVVLNLLGMAATGVLAARMLGSRQPMLWGGLAFLAYSVHPWVTLAFLGNNTPLVLLLVTVLAHEHLRGRDTRAGALLGAAIALKLWPLALLPLLLRERRWSSLVSTAAVVGLVATLSIAFLGWGAIGPAAQAMQAKAVIESDNPVFFVSWLRETQEWWPWWGGYILAAILVAIPARGLLGVGLGMFAGLALVPNLWRTYVPTLVVAGLFVVRAIAERSGAAKDRASREISGGESARSVGPDPAPDMAAHREI